MKEKVEELKGLWLLLLPVDKDVDVEKIVKEAFISSAILTIEWKDYSDDRFFMVIDHKLGTAYRIPGKYGVHILTEKRPERKDKIKTLT